MAKLTTLYSLLKTWKKELKQLQEKLSGTVNPQAIEVTEKMLESTRKEYIDRGGRRPI